MARCPSCKTKVAPRDQNPSFPFCSPRCRAVDLGRWVTGAYAIPGKVTDGEGDEPGADEAETSAPDEPVRKTDA